MPPDEVNSILNKVLEMTHQMLSLAKQENWVEVAKLEGERKKILIENLSDSSIDKSGKIRDITRQVIEIDQELQSLLITARNEIRDELVEINKIKSQAKAYESK